MTEPQARVPSVEKQVDKNKDDHMPTQNPHRIVGLCTSSKVYNALTELKQLEGHRSAKFLSLLTRKPGAQGPAQRAGSGKYARSGGQLTDQRSFASWHQ